MFDMKYRIARLDWGKEEEMSKELDKRIKSFGGLWNVVAMASDREEVTTTLQRA